MLDAVTSVNPGMKVLSLDIEDPKGIQTFAATIITDFPLLNAVVHNAGIARMEKLKEQPDVREVESMVSTNVLGSIRLNAVLLPHLLQQPKATVMAKIKVSNQIRFFLLQRRDNKRDLSQNDPHLEELKGNQTAANNAFRQKN